MASQAPAAVPDAGLAAAIAGKVEGAAPSRVSRFPTGARHYVYEAAFADRPPIVVRIGDSFAHTEMAGACHLSALLRPLGVPLPALLAADIDAELPWLVLERLPGTDLGGVIGGLSDAQLVAIAGGIARAQGHVASTPAAGRYGYAARPEQAPCASWPEVLERHLRRSLERIAGAGLFDTGPVDRTEAVLHAARHRLERQPPIPFLHDTTTKNVIIAPDGTLSGIVDVDDLCFGDPRYPAALTLASLTVSGGPLHYVSEWLRQAGMVDDADFRLYVALFLLDFMGEHGQAFNGNQRPSTPEARAALLAAFEANWPRLLTEAA